MKNNGIVRNSLSLLVSVLMVFALTGTFLMFTADRILSGPDWMISRIEKTGTYQNAYDGLMKRFGEISAQTSVPAEVYSSAVSQQWLSEQIRQKVCDVFNQLDTDGEMFVPDQSLMAEKITEYFEKYALENHVIKDEKYTGRLESVIENARKTVELSIDVYHTDTLQKTGLWKTVVRVRSLVSDKLPAAAALVILFVLLAAAGDPLYWGGTSLAASGTILTLPSAVILLSGVIMRFSVKEYTVFTLVTGAVRSVVSAMLTGGIIMMVTEIVLIIISVIVRENTKTISN